jgi:NAD(P)-dependent dehydrogenase (short-subunit alcohol dehydrogenase family)
LARAYTGRSKVLCCGYHGWHDWYIAVTDRDRGVPSEVKHLTYTFDYNNLDSLDRALDADVACVILEPVAFEEPRDDFLAALRERCVRNKSLLIFDEMWTGFRASVGGAQEYYGVVPDLSTFSKAVANGMPLGVLAGRAEVLALLDREVFFFSTFGGEALSLAAAQATLTELVAQSVPAHLARQGQRIKDAFNRTARDLGLDALTRCVGPAWRTLVMFDRAAGDPLELKSLVQQELIRRGILWSGTHVVSLAHGDAEVAELEAAYGEVLEVLRDAIQAGNARRLLRGRPVEPVFRRTGQFNTKPRPARAPDLFSLVGRTAVITGAAGLLGRQHAAALADAGAHVVLLDVAEGPLESLAADLRRTASGQILPVAADVTDAASLARARARVVERTARVDILVNNAAINDKVEAPDQGADAARFERYDLEHWRRVLDVNVTGVFLPSQTFGALMAEHGGGSIINVASTYALVGPDPSLYAGPDGSQPFVKAPAYPTSKGAVLSLTRFLAAYWGHRAVRVNALVPGGVENGQDPGFIARYAARTPLGRMAAPDDYRGALVFLAGDASRYMTGSFLVVDGGFTAW